MVFSGRSDIDCPVSIRAISGELLPDLTAALASFVSSLESYMPPNLSV